MPAAGVIPPHSTVIVVADEGMYGLNFETLVAPGERPHFWIEDVTLLNVSSLHMLAGRTSATPKANPSGRLLLIGDPVYSGSEFESLPHAREEMSDVAQHFDSARRLVLAGAEATPAAYQRSQPARFAYIHFVSHGVGSEADPLDSAVILSANPGASASYKLYAREILNDPLHADLVTISSCYGSGVRSYSGEGLVGLNLGVSARRLAPCDRCIVGGKRRIYPPINERPVRRPGPWRRSGGCLARREAGHDSARRYLPQTLLLGIVSAVRRGIEASRSSGWFARNLSLRPSGPPRSTIREAADFP